MSKCSEYFTHTVTFLSARGHRDRLYYICHWIVWSFKNCLGSLKTKYVPTKTIPLPENLFLKKPFLILSWVVLKITILKTSNTHQNHHFTRLNSWKPHPYLVLSSYTRIPLLNTSNCHGADQHSVNRPLGATAQKLSLFSRCEKWNCTITPQRLCYCCGWNCILRAETAFPCKSVSFLLQFCLIKIYALTYYPS